MNLKNNTNIKNQIKIIFLFLLSFISIISFNSNFDAINNKITFNGNSFMYIILLSVYFYILKSKIFKGNKRLNIVSGVFSYIITNIYIISYITSKFLLNGYMPESKTYWIFIIAKFLTCLLFFFMVIK